MLAAIATGEAEATELWLANGGADSLLSWGVPRSAQPKEWPSYLPKPHLMFLRDLAVRHAAGGYLFVHAGIRPGIPLERQSRHDLMWIREPFLSFKQPFGPVVVHGHTPRQEPVVRPNRIGIDTGAVMGGVLTCAVLEEDRLGFITSVNRELLALHAGRRPCERLRRAHDRRPGDTSPTPPTQTPAWPPRSACLARTSVLVVGDVMLDRYIYGTVERISPEAPVPILAIEREVAMPGGAGNVVRNLTALGAAVAFISVVGRRPGGFGPDRPDRRPAERRALAAGAGRPHHHAEDPLARRRPAAAARRPRGDLADPAAPGRTPAAHRPRRDGGDLGHGAVGLPQGPAGGRPHGTADRGRARGGTARHRRPQGPGLFALCRRRRHHAEPHRPGRGDRHAGGRRGGDRRRRHRAAPAPRLRRGAGHPRQRRHDAAGRRRRDALSRPRRPRSTTSPAPATPRWRRWRPAWRRGWSCASRCGWPTSPRASWWGRSAPRSRARRTCWPRCRRRAARCARSSRARRRWSTCSAGTTRAGGSASPMAGSIRCSRRTCIAWRRRARPATGWWWD